MGSAFYEGGWKLLKPQAFAFVLDTELKQAVRSQNNVTLILVAARRDSEGVSVAADEGTHHEIARVFGKEIRDTDFLETSKRNAGGRTVGRGLQPLEEGDRSPGLAHREPRLSDSTGFAVGAACCPTHAVDLDLLKRQARARPVVSWRAGTRPSSAEN
jgi:hypothetical protein